MTKDKIYMQDEHALSLERWAREALSESGKFLNKKITRTEIYEDFIENRDSDVSTSPLQFKKDLIQFCKKVGLHFNPHMRNRHSESFIEWAQKKHRTPFVGRRYVEAGREYFYICTEQFIIYSSL